MKTAPAKTGAAPFSWIYDYIGRRSIIAAQR
jgi:hypothetical protein